VSRRGTAAGSVDTTHIIIIIIIIIITIIIIRQYDDYPSALVKTIYSFAFQLG